MPVQFLEQLFSTLRRDGLLHSQRGVKGGYTLARPPEEITVLEVVQALDGKVGAGGRARPAASGREGVEALRGVFSSTTIADIARREADEAGAACTTSERSDGAVSGIDAAASVRRDLAAAGVAGAPHDGRERGDAILRLP